MKLRTLFYLPLLLGIVACGAKAEEKVSADTLFDIRVGDVTVQMELALTGPEQQEGLMKREHLPDNQGMLFIYRKPSRMGFWMKDTTIPLDIGFFSNKGILKEIHPLFPLELETVESKSDEIQFALEMNRDWFKTNGIKPGARINIKDVKKALKARGFPPAAISSF